MSDAASSSRTVPPSPDPDGPGRAASGTPRQGTPSGSQSGSSPVDNPPTVITQRPPPKPPSASDAVSAFQQWGLAPGDRLAHFELLDFVGGGGMGRVFRARDRHLSRTVALKVLSPDQAADAATLMRFRNEAQSAARLDHPNIVRVFYLGEDRGIPFIVFEYIEGQNIRDLVANRGPLGLVEAAGYTLQVAEALAHAARHEVVHRDIKPSNVLVTPDGVAKIIDLGLARVQDPTANDLTASGVTLGTFDYISPEQARDPRTADVRSDIYSLGCTFFYMLAGRPPFPEGTVLQKLLQHQGDQPPDVRELRSDLPDEVPRLLRKMLAKDPRHRHQTPAELVEELSLVAEQLGLRPERAASAAWVPKPQPAAPFWERHLPWIMPVAALVLIVFVFDFFSASRDDRSGRTAVATRPAPDAADAEAPKPAERISPAPSAGPAEPATAPVAAIAPAGTEKTAVTTPAAKPEPVVEATAKPAPADSSPAAVREPDLAKTPPTSDPVETPTEPASRETEPTAAAKPAAPTGLLVVGEALPGARTFSSLSAACVAAASGDVIELRYNGRRPQRPTVLGNVKVTIRGGDGYRPILVFRPDDPDPVRFPHSMLSIIGGQLTLRNVAVELEIPRDLPAESWSLFEILGGESVRLRNCWLTIRNAGDQAGDYHQDAAFFRLRQAPGADLSTGGLAATTTPANIELDDCVARGEATFLRTEGLQPLRLNWANGLLVTSQFLLSADGGPEPPRASELRQLDLRHVTALMRRGLCRMTVSRSSPHQLPTQVRTSDSIFVGAPGGALIEHAGSESVDQCRSWIEWNGDRVFYQGWESFWTIKTSDASAAPESMTFDAWQLYWGRERESRPELNRVVWKSLPEATRPAHVQSPTDYDLGGDSNTNPARGAASDGEDAGLESADLPLPPADTDASPAGADDSKSAAKGVGRYKRSRAGG